MERGPFLPGEQGAGTAEPEHAAVLLRLHMYKEWEPELTGYRVAPPFPALADLGLACLPAAARSPPRAPAQPPGAPHCAVGFRLWLPSI